MQIIFINTTSFNFQQGPGHIFAGLAPTSGHSSHLGVVSKYNISNNPPKKV